MSDIIGKFTVIILGAVLLFYLPVMIYAVKMDNTSQSYIDNAVMEFVDDARASARITPEAYEEMLTKVYAAHSPCEVTIAHMSSYSVPNGTSILTTREYYSKDEILQVMYPDTGDPTDYVMKKGDYLKVTVTNETPTLGGRLLSIIIPNYDWHTLFTSYGGYVGNNIQ
jgi:hypothetical protein